MKPFITFKNLGEYGRLGNQLFQWAALSAVAKRNDCDIRIPPLCSKYWHGQKCLLDEFNINYEIFTWRDSEQIRYHYKEPDPMKFDSAFLDVKPNAEILGFFQSIRYFEEFQDQIVEELWPKSKNKDTAFEYCPIEKKQLILEDWKEELECSQIVSVGIRRGDNIDSTNPIQSQMFNEYFETKYVPFLKSAMQKFDDNAKFLIFSGGSRKIGNDNSDDMKWCMDAFGDDDRFLFSSNKSVLEDLYTILACDGHIMSPASSFSWWSCYLSFMKSNQQKTVVVPNEYHPDIPGYTHREGFYRPEWHVL